MERKRKATNNGKRGNENFLVQVPWRSGRKRSYPPPFLMKTFEIVEDPETNCIISWSPTNTSFIIWDQIRFTTELLHKYFRHSNFSSFVYQLNNYGFKKVSWEKYEYENPWFQAGKRHLLSNIKRRNQRYDYNIAPQQHGSDGSSDEMEEQFETLVTEQHGLKEEIHELNQHQRDIKYRLNALQENMKVAEREKRDLVSQVLVRHFIKNLRKMSKKQKLDQSIIIQTEGQAISGGSDQHQQDNIGTSEHAENCAFWKRIMEDESEQESRREDHDQAEKINHSKVNVKLEDLIGSSTPMEGENDLKSCP